MIFIAKEEVYKRANLKEGVFLNLEIHDINTYFDRFNNTLNVNFGVFQNIEDELIEVEIINLSINDDIARTGYVMLPDESGEGESTIAIEEYFEREGNIDDVVINDYGSPNVELALTLFDGGGLDSPEITPINDLAKKWLLNTLEFDGEKIAVNFDLKDE